MNAIPIVVIGASAGGMDALQKLVGQLPEKLGAAVFVVQHMSADGNADVLVGSLSKAGRIRCTVARDGETFEARHICRRGAWQQRDRVVTHGSTR